MMKSILIILTILSMCHFLYSQVLEWKKYEGNPILETGSSEWENYFTSLYCLKDNNEYKLYYTGMLPNQKEVGLATSLDGYTWTKNPSNPVLRRGVQNWSSFRLIIGSVLKIGSTYYAFYYGDNQNLYAKGSIGVATSPDGINWTQYEGNPIISYTEISPGDQGIGVPKVIFRDGMFHMYFVQKVHNRWIYATSSDGFNWDIFENNDINLPMGINTIQFDGSIHYAIRQIANNDSVDIWLSEDGVKWTQQVPSALLPYQDWQTTAYGTKQGYFSFLVDNDLDRLMLFFNSSLGKWGYKKMGIAFAENIFNQSMSNAPSNLIALANGKFVKLSWKDNSVDEDGFIIKRKKGQNGTWQEIYRTDANVVLYKDFNIEQEYIYYYRVRAFKNDWVSDYSNEYYAITMNTPSDLVAFPENQNQIYLSWKDQTDNETGYTVERKVSDQWQIIKWLPKNSHEFTDIDVIEGIEYTYRVRAYANSGQPEPHYSEYSNVATLWIPKEADSEWYGLTFPLKGKDPYSAEINAVFDHSMIKYYDPGKDGVVMAFSGEKGEIQYDAYQDGYKQKSGDKFIVNGNYTAGSRNPDMQVYLFYDGHPAIDYRSSTGTVIYAPDDGEILIPENDPVNSNPSKFNTIMVKHKNDITTVYLHCSKHLKKDGEKVKKGEAIALVGSVGSDAPHLHFEVRKNNIPVDPYGWQGIGVDPYTNASNAFLWDVYTDKTVWSFDNSFEKWRTRDAQNKGVNVELGGKWIIDPGEDPGIVSPRLLNIDSKNYPKLQIKMSFYGGGNSYPGKPVVYIKQYGSPNFTEISFNKEIIPDGKLHVYEADIPEDIGRIKEIRIDPIEKGDPDFEGDRIFIDYIRFIHYNNLTIISQSPVNLKLYSPRGLFVQKDTTNLFDAFYDEFDMDDDQELEDIISINNPEEGTYFLSVRPDSTAKPGDVFVVLKIENGDTTVVIDTTKIEDIPDSLYQIEYKKATKIFTQDDHKILTDFELYQNYPNPFNTVTNIQFKLSRKSHVNLEIYDITGRKITTVLNKKLPPGSHHFVWEAQNYASGIYIYKLTVEGQVLARKMVLLK